MKNVIENKDLVIKRIEEFLNKLQYFKDKSPEQLQRDFETKNSSLRDLLINQIPNLIRKSSELLKEWQRRHRYALDFKKKIEILINNLNSAINDIIKTFPADKTANIKKFIKENQAYLKNYESKDFYEYYKKIKRLQNSLGYENNTQIDVLKNFYKFFKDLQDKVIIIPEQEHHEIFENFIETTILVSSKNSNKDYYTVINEAEIILTDLKHFIEEKESQNNKIPPKKLEEVAIQGNNNPLQDDEKKVLFLRKHLSPNTFKKIGENMTPVLKESSIKAISTNLRNKLGVNNIDEAVRVYEEKFEKL